MMLLLRCVLFAACLVGLATAQPRTPREPVAVDRIVAVVNDEVITHHELRVRLDSALSQLQRQGMSPPPRDVLERQVLERLVIDKVQLQLARDMGLRVDDGQLEQALQRIAAGNKLSLPQFRAALEKDGIAFASFREEIRAEMTIAGCASARWRARSSFPMARSTTTCPACRRREALGEEYQLAHILLRAPESASPEQIQKLRAKADQVLEQLRKGADFAQLAAAYSDAPDGMKGGNLGWRPLDRLPPMFAETASKLTVGEVSPVLRSANGFHLIKLIAKRGGGAAQTVEQTHARHILIKVNEIMSEPEARHKLEGLRSASAR
jgi:peptidyl-prolyl cis-trans isomerase SurA